MLLMCMSGHRVIKLLVFRPKQSQLLRVAEGFSCCALLGVIIVEALEVDLVPEVWDLGIFRAQRIK